jgi:tetratricopeptide (TPR) repeat protein
MSARFRYITVWSFVAALGLVVAAPPLLAQGSGRASGIVRDAEGNPLEGVEIVAENPNLTPPRFETTTGSDGRFAMVGFVSGQWSFMATLEGYQSSSIPSARVGQIPSQNSELSFVLSRNLHPLEVALGVAALEGLDPEGVQAEFDGADGKFNSGDWDGAIAGYSDLLEKLPMLTNLHLRIGNTYRAKEDYEAAIAAYERLKVADPNNTQADTEIARTKMAMGDFEGAAVELAVAASGLDATREDLYNVGELEFAKGEIDLAAGWYEKASMVAPTWGKPLFKLALVALNRGDTAGAKELFQKVVDVDPDSEEAAQATATIAALP